MNSKKRNKNKSSKPPTPNPPQKDDVLIDTETTAKNVEEIPQVIIKSEERVPEILSEVITPAEAKVSEDDTPKKPKRNRGKKKKGDKEETNKMLREMSAESHKTDSEIKVDTSIDETTAKTLEVPVTPAARKKKNKNKNKPGQQNERIGDEQKLNIVPISKEEFMPDLKIINLVPIATDETEEGKSKKKNKIKKRLDSEKSDKPEEVLSCTSAFQKLLEPKDDKKETKTDEKVDLKLLTYEESVPTPQQQDKTTEKIDLKEELCASDDVNKHPESFKTESKNKKKNKKDKKFPSKFETEVTDQSHAEACSESLEIIEHLDSAEENLETCAQKEDISNKNVKPIKLEKEQVMYKMPEEKNIDTQETGISIDIKAQEVKSAESKEAKHNEDKSAIPISIQVEDSGKSKVKIVKPVDKKPTKRTTDEQNVEEISHNIGFREEIIKTDTPVPEPNIKVTEFLSTEQLPELPKEEVKIDIKSKSETQESKTDNNATDQKQTEQIQVPEERGKKKRKKSPKPSKAIYTAPDLRNEFDDIIPKQDFVEKNEEDTTGIKETNMEIKEEPIITTPEDTVLTPDLPQIQPMTSKKDIKQVPEHKPVENVFVQPPPPSKDDKENVENILTENLELKQEPIKNETTHILLTSTLLAEEPPIQVKPAESIEIPHTPTEIKHTEAETEFLKSEHMPVKQSESGKRRKKSPKPKKNAVTPEKPEVKEEQKTSTTEKQSKDSIQESKASLDIPSLVDDKSLNAGESDTLTYDVVPEVHQPRATSLDNNNNMVIRDITSIDEGKLNIPIVLPDIPLVQGSGESPTPGISSTGITITEVYTQSKPEEKTDLKSKVIEVNKDMEDLRRSIERSLAELTAMEKSEEQTEKKFEEAQAKIEAIKNLANKQETPVKTEETATTKDDPNLIQKSEAEVMQVTEHQAKPEEQKPITEFIQPRTELIQAESTTESLPVPIIEDVTQVEEQKPVENVPVNIQTPPAPPRKDNKGKNKKKKGKQTAEHVASTQSATESVTSTTGAETKQSKSEDKKNDDKSEHKPDSKEETGKQQSASFEDNATQQQDLDVVDFGSGGFEPIENFEDALTSNDAIEDVNKTFEMMANEANSKGPQNNPHINVVAPTEDDEKQDGNEKINPVSQPKNLIGHPDIPARLNKADYKKEKNKTPNTKQAKVKIKDSVPIELNKQSKECQTDNKRRFLKDKTVIETVSSIISDSEEYIYKYSFRRVFLPSACHTCKKDLKFGRSPCNFCNLIFYCGPKHRDEDYPQHQALCFAVSTIAHLKEQKYIYGEAQGITGQDYRLLRMQMIVSCEKVLKRRLAPWEQEVLLYPRICADVDCREWRQGKLEDCEGCEQISYCSDNPNHLPKDHQRFCKSYSLYQKLVTYQQTQGRLEPKLPGKVMIEDYRIPEKMNEILATMYEERIDMNDIQYAALTQVATAPLTAAYCQQLYTNKIGSVNGMTKKSTFTIHVVGAELQFEADALHKWEVFFLHLKPEVKDLRLVLIGPELNPSNLPLDLLAKTKLCESCRQDNRRVTFDFQDKKTYNEYWSTDFTTPDLVCAFNPSIQRSSIYNGKDTWPSAINCITKQKVPLVITSYTLEELDRDLTRIEQCSDVEIDVISEPKYNPFASVRPDRNFISDDEMPLLFKNFCYSVVCGRF